MRDALHLIRADLGAFLTMVFGLPALLFVAGLWMEILR